MKKIFFMLILLGTAALSGAADEIIVAKVNGAAITGKELDEAVDRLIPRATFHGNVSNEKRAEFRDKALEELITRELLYQDALARGLKPDKKQVKADMQKIRDRFPSKAEYKKALGQAGIIESGLRERIEKDVLVQMVTARAVTEPAQMSETDVKEYYEANVAKFTQPESVKLRIISSKDEKKAKQIMAKVKAGEDFGAVAAQMSEDNYRIKGGDIGYVHRGRIYPELEAAAFKLKPGETSGLIKAEGTWFIIKVEDKRQERQRSYDEVKDKLKKDLETKRAGELREKWIADLRAKAKIEVVKK